MTFPKYNRLLLIIAFIISISNVYYSNAEPPIKNFRYIENNAFDYGEELHYKVGYMFMTAGTAKFIVLPKPIYRNNRKCYDIRFRVRSLQSLAHIYKVKDDYRTIIDESGIFPWEFAQRIREGNYKKDYKAEFDQINNLVYARDSSYSVPKYIHDIVSAFYYVRTMNLRNMEKGDMLYLQNFIDEEVHDLGVKFHGRETITVEGGTYKCIKIEPIVVKGGLFKSDGKIMIWLTDDDRKIPVKVSTRIPIGSVEGWLIDYKGLNGPIKARIK